MKENRLFLYLQRFNKKDLRSFKKYLNLVHPKKKIAHQLFEYLVKYHPEYDHPKNLDPNYIYQKIFQQPCNSDKKRKNILNTHSDLTRWIQDFWVAEELSKHQSIYDWLLAQKLREKNMIEEEKRIIRKNTQGYEKKGDKRTPWDFFWESRFRHMRYYSAYSDKIKEKENFEQLIKVINQLFHSYQLKYTSEAFSRKNLINEEMEIPFDKEIIEYQIQNPSSNLLIDLYYNLINFQKDEAKDHSFFRLKEKLLNNYKFYPLEDKEIIHAYLLNYSFFRSKEKFQFLQETIDLINFAEETNLLTYDNTISPTRFIFPIKAAVLLGKHKWAATYRKKYSCFLPKEQKEEVIAFTDAITLFHNGNYQSARDLLYDINISPPLLSTSCKCYLLASIYETKMNQNYLFDQCKTLEMFIRQNKALKGSTFKEESQNLINFIRALSRGKVPLENLKAKLEKSKYVYLRYWLEKKLTD